MIGIDHKDGVARLTLCVPPLNILTRAALCDLRSALAALDGDARVRVLLLDATGKHFSAGASVEEHLPPEHALMLPEFTETVIALHEFPQPVIAAVQGRCLGGGFELVQAADLIVAAESARFGQPEIVLGVFAPAACALLAERIGPTRAAELMFTGDPITAQDALAAGLVTRVVPDEQLPEQASSMAQRIARHSGSSLRVLKRAMRAGAHQPDVRASVGAAARVYTDDLMATRDALEGLQAFLAKRPAEWCHQ